MTLSLYNIIGMKMKHLKMKSNNVKILHCFGALITLTVKKLRQYQVGNTISRKITEVKQLVPLLAPGWVTIQVLKWML